jgi:Gene product 88
MVAELQTPRFAGRWVRIHDSGDFFSDDYLRAWTGVCRAGPGVNFYCYTKEIDRFRRLVEPDPPDNLHWVYSYGGVQDHSLNPGPDRVADVFPTRMRSTGPAGHLSVHPTCSLCWARRW